MKQQVNIQSSDILRRLQKLTEFEKKNLLLCFDVTSKYFQIKVGDIFSNFLAFSQ